MNMNEDEINYWSLYWYKNLCSISTKLKWLIRYEDLSCNENITSVIVENNMDKYWDFDDIIVCSKNRMNELLDNLLNTRQIQWSFSNTISCSRSLKFEYIQEYSYLDDDWDWYEVSRNENITMDIIELNLDYPWDWDSVSDNPNLTIDFVNKYPEFEWDWTNITCNSNITPEIIEKNMHNPWVWEEMHFNKNITPEFIEKHKDKKWDFYNLFRCTMLNDKSIISKKIFIEKLEDINSKLCDCNSNIVNKQIFVINDHYSLSQNSNTTWDIVEKYPKLGWHWDKLSSNDNITIDVIENNIDKNWDWNKISLNPNVTRDFIIKHKDKNWCWMTLFINNKIEFDYIKDKISPNEYNILSKSYEITLKIIEDNLDKPWDWFYLSCNRNIFMDDIENTMKWEWFKLNTNFKSKTFETKYINYRKNLKFKWDLEGILSNRNLTFKFINDNYNIILQHKNNNWEHIILQHSMEYEMKQWHSLRVIKTLQIQKHWRNCSSNPSYKLAQRLLLKTYNA